MSTDSDSSESTIDVSPNKSTEKDKQSPKAAQGKGNKKLSLCNINNIVTVVSNILNNKVSEGIYNVSDNTEYTYNDLLNKFNPDFIIPIPLILLKLLYLFGVVTKNNFIKENTIKLVTHNVFPSKKIIDHLILDEGLNYTLNEEFN